MKLLDELNSAKNTCKRLQNQYKEVVGAIKDQVGSSLYCNEEDKFRNAICLYYGEFVDRHSMRYLPNRLKISKAVTWDNDLKHRKSRNYYSVSKVFGDIIRESSEIVGFACEVKHLKEALEYKLRKLWLLHVNENNYTQGFETFKVQIDSKEIDLLKLFTQYYKSTSHVVTVMHHPSLKMSNIVLFIKNTY